MPAAEPKPTDVDVEDKLVQSDVAHAVPSLMYTAVVAAVDFIRRGRRDVISISAKTKITDE